MKRRVIIYGSLMAVLLSLLKLLEYKYYLKDLSLEFYISVVAVLSTVIGIWLGLQFVKKTEKLPGADYKAGLKDSIPLSKREKDVLQLMANGCSNQEIADKLFISLSTVKSHISSIFQKLGVKRRTVAILKAKELKIVD